MEWYIFLGGFLATMVVLLMLRVPVAFAMLGTGIVGSLISYNTVNAASRQVGLSVLASVDSFVFTAIPLFIFMGELLFQTKIAQQALGEIARVLGRLPGRLAMVAVGGGAMFGLLSGSTLANTALFGRTLLPQMRARGYDERLSTGSILAAGGLAMILPPSAFAILWGGIAEVPIGPLLIAGIIPGILMAIGYAIIVVFWSMRTKADTTKEPSRTWAEIIRDGFKNALAPGLLIAVVLGLIFFGIATPTESAAVGALAALVLGVVMRRLSVKSLLAAAVGTVQTTAMIFMIVLGSTLYSQLMSFNGATQGLVRAVTGSITSSALMLLVIMVVVLILGAFIDQVSIMMVTAPLFMPIVAAFNWDPVWFSILLMINLQIANTTPPFGMSLFVMKGVSPSTPLTTLYKASLPWIGSDLVVMLLIAMIPSIALILPSLMG
ncbi:TRAP transporter large permease [Granulicoccus sp. GXG6511]|uniref:TRAP transporter large permease n=1 Tax=Granulicoccus sp. GXG6511 TaxID=3381351 RepID=UPI003D7CE30F